MIPIKARRILFRVPLAAALDSGLTACGQSSEPEGEVSERVLGDIDVLEGTESDAMITVDQFENAQPVEAETEADSSEAPSDDNTATN